MSSDRPRIEPPDVVMAVEQYVSRELSDAEKYENRTPLDESGIWSLHALAARIYAMGWEGGERSTDEKTRAERVREHDRRRKGAPTPRTAEPRETQGEDE